MKNIKLAPFPGIFPNYCMSTVVDGEMLNIPVALNPKHMEGISRILEESKDTGFQIWSIQKYRKVNEFLNK